MIKKWLERLPSRLPLTQLACTLVQTSCMQAEIDELRAENARLKANLETRKSNYNRLKAMVDDGSISDRTFSLCEELEKENARLRDALGMMVHAQSSILGLGDSPVVKFARAALGEKS